jgi:hypothetical protein
LNSRVHLAYLEAKQANQPIAPLVSVLVPAFDAEATIADTALTYKTAD